MFSGAMDYDGCIHKFRARLIGGTYASFLDAKKRVLDAG
jgi:hypothetical protein